MANSSGIQPLYGAVIRDKCLGANMYTMKAYQTVGNDLLKDLSGRDADDLRAALSELEKAIREKSG